MSKKYKQEIIPLVDLLQKVSKEKLKLMLAEKLNVHIPVNVREKVVSVAESEEELNRLIVAFNQNQPTLTTKLISDVEGKYAGIH